MSYQTTTKPYSVKRSGVTVNFNVSGVDDTKDHFLIELVNEGCRAANVPVDWEGLTYPALAGGQCIIARRDDGTPLGFVFFLSAQMPFTLRTAVVEQLLYVHEKHRGSHLKVADGLLHMLERVAREEGAQDIFAGSSLNHNEAARRVYQRAGFTTTYAFKKDITDV